MTVFPKPGKQTFTTQCSFAYCKLRAECEKNCAMLSNPKHANVMPNLNHCTLKHSRMLTSTTIFFSNLNHGCYMPNPNPTHANVMPNLNLILNHPTHRTGFGTLTPAWSF